jgi:ATP-binding cassette, subfamily C, bacterial LapB
VSRLIDIDDAPDVDDRAGSQAGAPVWSEDPAFSHDGLIWLGQQLTAAGVARRRLLAREALALARPFLVPDGEAPHQEALALLLDRLDVEPGAWVSSLEPMALPVVALVPGQGYGFVYAAGGSDVWLLETPGGRQRCAQWPDGTLFLPVSSRRKAVVQRSARDLFAAIMQADRGWVPLSAIATTLASILVLATSLYSMQVYDRVIGQGGFSTLIVLTVGVMIAILVELALKIARSAIMDRAIARIDVDASVAVYARLLAVRIDQLPASLGTLAAQVRGFETVRSFDVARIIYLATDLPFALFFLAIILIIGGPVVALVPGLAFVIAAIGGFSLRKAISDHSTREVSVANKRQGILVETIQSAEAVKASGAGWLLQGRWNALSRMSADESMKIKHLNDMAGYFSGFVQQASYVLLVAAGAYLAVESRSLTTGAIIACSIISGRVLTPVSALPGLLVQWANAKVALDNLEQLFVLERDNHGIEHPLSPEATQGRLELRHVEFAWPGQSTPFAIDGLTIAPGERVAVIGSVGSGKSTLLKLLAGMVKASKGLVCLDGMDVQHIAADRRAELIG